MNEKWSGMKMLSAGKRARARERECDSNRKITYYICEIIIAPPPTLANENASSIKTTISLFVFHFRCARFHFNAELRAVNTFNLK